MIKYENFLSKLFDKRDIFAIIKDNDYDAVKKYIKNKGDVNKIELSGKSVLMIAAQYRCDPEILIALIDSSADLEFKTNNHTIYDYLERFYYTDLPEYQEPESVLDMIIEIYPEKTTLYRKQLLTKEFNI